MASTDSRGGGPNQEPLRGLTREQMARRAAQEIPHNGIVNLGIGIPTLVANYIPPDRHALIHSENGLLGVGPFPFERDLDPDLINAGKQTVTAVPGASFFHSAESFGMIRGGHVDLAFLGAMQVDTYGNLANWMVPGKTVKGMGGAMDLVSGAKRVIVVTNHCDKSGRSKLVEKCTFPLTGLKCVNRVVTDLAVLDITPSGFYAVELAPGVTWEELKSKTEGRLVASPTLSRMTGL